MSWSTGTIRPQSHRVRLTVLVSFVFGTLTAGLFTAAAVYNSIEQRREIDARLDSSLHAVVSDIQHDTPAEYLQILRRNGRGFSGAVFESDGKLIVSEGPINLPLLTGRGFVTLNGTPVIYATTIAQGKSAVVADEWQNIADGGRRLNLLLFLVWLPLTALVGLVTWLAVTRTFRPLLDMAEEAGRLSTQGGGARLAEPPDQEFGQLAKHLNAFLDQREKQTQLQEQFLQNAAHELRTPLTILRGQSETALLSARDVPEYRRVLELTVDEARRMSELVEALLLSSRAAMDSAGPLQLAGPVQDAVDRWADRFAAAGVSLRAALQPAMAPITAPEIEIILDNLIHNALSHSPAGTECIVKLESHGPATRVVVSDQGSGVPDGRKESVFDRFYRTDESRNRGTGGFGIGLAICRKISGVRSATIRVEDNHPVGSKFVVEWAQVHSNSDSDEGD